MRRRGIDRARRRREQERQWREVLQQTRRAAGLLFSLMEEKQAKFVFEVLQPWQRQLVEAMAARIPRPKLNIIEGNPGREWRRPGFEPTSIIFDELKIEDQGEWKTIGIRAGPARITWARSNPADLEFIESRKFAFEELCTQWKTFTAGEISFPIDIDSASLPGLLVAGPFVDPADISRWESEGGR